MKDNMRIRKLAGINEARKVPDVLRAGSAFETPNGHTVVVKDLYITGATRKPITQVAYDIKTVTADGSENPWRRHETLPLDKFSDLLNGKL